MKTISTILIALVLLVTFSQVELPVNAGQDYQLNLSHIECKGTYVEIHFVLLNTSEGDSISNLTYTYGTIPPGARTGNVVHFTDNVAPGYYNITSASVSVNSTLVTLHNPGSYAGYYGCQQQPTNTPIPPTNTPVPPTETPVNTPTNTVVPPKETPVNTPTNTVVPPTETPVNTPTNTVVPPTETPVNTPTNTVVPPTETPSSTPEPTRLTTTPDPTATVGTPNPTGTIVPTDPTGTIVPTDPTGTVVPTDPTGTVVPTDTIVSATFSVPHTGRDDSFFGPGFILTGMVTLGLGIALNTILRKANVTKRK